MRKKRLFLCLFCLILFFPSVVKAESEKTFVFDYADLLNAEQESELQKLCEKYGPKGKVDIILVTVNENNGKDCETYLEDMYDEYGFGYNKPYGDTVMIIIDMNTREVCIEGYGEAQYRVDQKRGDKIRNKITPDLTDGNYYKALSSFVKLSSQYMRIRPGINPDNIFFKLWFQIPLSLVVGFLVVLSLLYHSKSNATVSKQTYLDPAHSGILSHRDDYVRTHTTRVKRPTEDSHGNSGSGSSGGGTSSGGNSHSTSKGSF